MSIGLAQIDVSKNDRRVVQLASRGSIDLQVSDMLVDGRLDIYPHVERLGLLSLQLRRNTLTLSAGPYIGLIPLTPTVSVNVIPKLPIGNLSRVLDAARGTIGTITGVDRLYLSNDLASNSVLEFLASNLIDALSPLHENGLLKEYAAVSEVTGNPRGRIDLSSTMMKAWSKGQMHQVASRRFEQTSDVPINRLIKSALHAALIRIKGESKKSKTLIASLNREYTALPVSIGEMRPSDFQESQSALLHNRLPRARRYYNRALEIAVMIMSNKGVSLQGFGNDVSLDSFIVNFESIFEDYLLNVLDERADRSKFQVLSGNGEGKKPLFDNRRDPKAQPDIVLSSIATGRKIIAEVKYKENPKREDYNQAITYAVTYRTNRTIIVHQNKPGAPAGLRHVGTMNGIVLDAYAFDLGSEDLDKEEAAFAECILAGL